MVFNTKCVTSSYFSMVTTFFTFLTGQKLWKFIWVKSDFWLHWIVSANFTSKYTLKTCILSFKFGQFHLSSFSLEAFCVLVSVRPDNFSTQILQKKQRNLVTNVVLVFQFHLHLYSIYLGRSKKLFLSQKKRNIGFVLTIY